MKNLFYQSHTGFVAASATVTGGLAWAILNRKRSPNNEWLENGA